MAKKSKKESSEADVKAVRKRNNYIKLDERIGKKLGELMDGEKLPYDASGLGWTMSAVRSHAKSVLLSEDGVQKVHVERVTGSTKEPYVSQIEISVN